MALFRPSNGLLVKLSVTDPFVSFVPPPFPFINIAVSLQMKNKTMQNAISGWIHIVHVYYIIGRQQAYSILTLLHPPHFWPNPIF